MIYEKATLHIQVLSFCGERLAISIYPNKITLWWWIHTSCWKLRWSVQLWIYNFFLFTANFIDSDPQWKQNASQLYRQLFKSQLFTRQFFKRQLFTRQLFTRQKVNLHGRQRSSVPGPYHDNRVLIISLNHLGWWLVYRSFYPDPNTDSDPHMQETSYFRNRYGPQYCTLKYGTFSNNLNKIIF